VQVLDLFSLPIGQPENTVEFPVTLPYLHA